tara:strand:- start:82 stop:261 length:180 start_codon:yes stop_codon:yes gene_type:complete
MSEYKKLAELNKLSDEMFAEFGFHSLTDEEKEEVLKHYLTEFGIMKVKEYLKNKADTSQ